MKTLPILLAALLPGLAPLRAEMVGIDDFFWGESIGLVTNPATDNQANWTGTIRQSAAQAWLDGESFFGIALIAPAPAYAGNGQLPLLQNNLGEPTLTFPTLGQGDVVVENGWQTDAALIKQDEPAFNDNALAGTWLVTPINDAPRPVLYKFPLPGGLIGEALTGDVRVSLQSNWSENSRTFHIYAIPVNWSQTTVTYGSLVVATPPLRITEVSLVGSDLALTFTSTPGRDYQIRWTDNLALGFTTVDIVPAAPGADTTTYLWPVILPGPEFLSVADFGPSP